MHSSLPKVDGQVRSLDGKVPMADPDAAMASRRDASQIELSDAGLVDGSVPPAGLALAALCAKIATNAEEVVCVALTELQCENTYLRKSRDECEALVRAVESGRLDYDGKAAESCLLASSQIWMPDALFRCPDVFTGHIMEGAECYRQYAAPAQECGRGLYCNQDALECPGHCRVERNQGESCNHADLRCAAELMCSRCVPPCTPTCQAIPVAGEPCDATDGICTDGLICDSTARPSVCLQPRADGASCEVDFHCMSGSCADGACAEHLVECDLQNPCPELESCVRQGSRQTCMDRAAAGEQCNDEQPDCIKGLKCAFDWVEQSYSCLDRLGTDGESCLPAGCEPDHHCTDGNGENGICRPDHNVGEACPPNSNNLTNRTYNSTCVEGLYCMHSSTGTCLPPGQLGDPCDDYSPDSCVDTLVCPTDGATVCELPPALGQACNPVFEHACAAGSCQCNSLEPNTCSWLCTPLLADDQPCDTGSDCISGYCGWRASAQVCTVHPSQIPACLLPE